MAAIERIEKQTSRCWCDDKATPMDVRLERIVILTGSVRTSVTKQLLMALCFAAFSGGMWYGLSIMMNDPIGGETKRSKNNLFLLIAFVLSSAPMGCIGMFERDEAIVFERSGVRKLKRHTLCGHGTFKIAGSNCEIPMRDIVSIVREDTHTIGDSVKPYHVISLCFLDDLPMTARRLHSLTEMGPQSAGTHLTTTVDRKTCSWPCSRFGISIEASRQL